MDHWCIARMRCFRRSCMYLCEVVDTYWRSDIPCFVWNMIWSIISWQTPLYHRGVENIVLGTILMVLSSWGTKCKPILGLLFLGHTQYDKKKDNLGVNLIFLTRHYDSDLKLFKMICTNYQNNDSVTLFGMKLSIYFISNEIVCKLPKMMHEF